MSEPLAPYEPDGFIYRAAMFCSGLILIGFTSILYVVLSPFLLTMWIIERMKK